jgi:hypothetical protein
MALFIAPARSPQPGDHSTEISNRSRQLLAAMPNRLDSLAKDALREWPSTIKELWPLPKNQQGKWVRAQPTDGTATGPRLMDAGAIGFRTQPDGMWVHLSEDFADCVAVEACSSQPNLADKRSRYAPTTTATVLHCPLAWLLSKIGVNRVRWKLAGLSAPPTRDLVLPVRFFRVLFFLEDSLYNRWRHAGVPSAHEFVASYSSINSYWAPKMQEFLRQMSIERHFYTK